MPEKIRIIPPMIMFVFRDSFIIRTAKRIETKGVIIVAMIEAISASIFSRARLYNK